MVPETRYLYSEQTRKTAMQWRCDLNFMTSNLKSLFSGGFYTIEQSHSKLRIVVLNSVLWSGGGFRTEKSSLKARAQWEWLEQVLSKARRKNEMVNVTIPQIYKYNILKTKEQGFTRFISSTFAQSCFKKIY